jgi:hypothetical protein
MWLAQGKFPKVLSYARRRPDCCVLIARLLQNTLARTCWRKHRVADKKLTQRCFDVLCCSTYARDPREGLGPMKKTILAAMCLVAVLAVPPPTSAQVERTQPGGVTNPTPGGGTVEGLTTNECEKLGGTVQNINVGGGCGKACVVTDKKGITHYACVDEKVHTQESTTGPGTTSVQHHLWGATVEPLSVGECNALGGSVEKASGCGTGQHCVTVDQQNHRHTWCITQKQKGD